MKSRNASNYSKGSFEIGAFQHCLLNLCQFPTSVMKFIFVYFEGKGGGTNVANNTPYEVDNWLQTLFSEPSVLFISEAIRASLNIIISGG